MEKDKLLNSVDIMTIESCYISKYFEPCRNLSITRQAQIGKFTESRKLGNSRGILRIIASRFKSGIWRGLILGKLPRWIGKPFPRRQRFDVELTFFAFLSQILSIDCTAFDSSILLTLRLISHSFFFFPCRQLLRSSAFKITRFLFAFTSRIRNLSTLSPNLCRVETSG